MIVARPGSRTLGTLLLSAATGGGCGRLETLLQEPPTTPEQWCAQRPCVDLGGTILTEPLGTFLVFLLALLWLGAGIHFLRSRQGQRSRAFSGAALLLGGLGAAQAGIRHQAFSFDRKCAGRERCLLTNGFEVGYSVTQALSVSAMLTAVAYACATGGLRRGIVAYSILNAGAYVAVAAIGVTMPSRTLLFFEVLMLFALPGIAAVIALSAQRLARTRAASDRSLLAAALLLTAVQVAYFAYQAGGITQRLWAGGAGLYFSENDVLHVGMMLWLGYVTLRLGSLLHDAEPEAPALRE